MKKENGSWKGSVKVAFVDHIHDKVGLAGAQQEEGRVGSSGRIVLLRIG